ncbi:MAG: gamma-glutamyltransferase [Candidatus Bathyarchaeota archaeon]
MAKSTKFSLHKEEVIASRGVISTNHPLASAAGVEAYGHGGNAFDAAVASLFALTVVEPMMVSVFGAGFFVIRDGKTGKVETIDNYAVAPFAATDDMYEMVKERKPGQNIFETVGRKNQAGSQAVATPGTLKAWEHVVERYGELDLATVVAPAVKLAINGYRSSVFMSYVMDICKEYMVDYPETAKTFMPDGKPLAPGSKIVMPEYAVTLEKIASGGSDVLYKGEVGSAIVDYMESNDGLITMKDLRDYKLIDREPVKGLYRDDYDIYSMAPGSSGGTHIIQMLNILESFDVGSIGYGSVEHLHLMTETLKIAFADRQRFMGDPSVIDIPLEGILSKIYAKERANEIGEKARKAEPGDPSAYMNESGNTTHVSAMDKEGNMVAATQTLNNVFGSLVTVPGVGIRLNNCMALFDPRPGRANSVAGGKRMLSSMSPTVILRKGEPYMCIGTPGGLQIFPSVAQAIVNVVDFKMGVQEAVEAPRLWTMGIKGTPGEKLLVESGFSDDAIKDLIGRGHDVVKMNRVAGGMNGVLRDPETGLLHGGACWRADGAAMGVSGGYTKKELLEPNPLV